MKHLIFDYNGPIVKAENFCENRSKRIANIFEAEWTPRFQEIWTDNYDLLSVGEIDIKDYYNIIAESLDRKIKKSNETWHIAEDKKFIEGDRLVDENIPQYLKELRENYPQMKIGLLSNYVQHWVTESLDRYDLRRCFDVIIVSDRVKMLKPDSRIYRLTANVMGVPAYDCGYVGDSINDLTAARQAAMKTIFMVGEESDPESHSLVDNLGELEQYLSYEKPKKTMRQRLIKLLE